MSAETPSKLWPLLGAFAAMVVGVGVAALVVFLALPPGCIESLSEAGMEAPVDCLMLGTLAQTLPLAGAFVLAGALLVRDRQALGWTLGEPKASLYAALLAGTAMAVPLGVGLLLGVLSISGASQTSSMALVLATLVLAACSEELIFRSYLLATLERFGRPYLALVIQALLFAGVHAANPDASAAGLLGVLLAGLYLGLLTQATRSILPACAFHVVWNISQGCLWGFPVSGIDLPSVLRTSTAEAGGFWGGEFGPEAGAPWLALLVGLVLWQGWRMRRQDSSDAAADSSATTDSGAAPSPR